MRHGNGRFINLFYSKSLISLTISGALISHEKLLLQINTEREIGNMSYKLGQVGKATFRRFILCGEVAIQLAEHTRYCCIFNKLVVWPLPLLYV